MSQLISSLPASIQSSLTSMLSPNPGGPSQVPTPGSNPYAVPSVQRPMMSGTPNSYYAASGPQQ